MTTAHIPSGLMNIWSILAGLTFFQVVQEIALQDYTWQPGKARGAVKVSAEKTFLPFSNQNKNSHLKMHS